MRTLGSRVRPCSGPTLAAVHGGRFSPRGSGPALKSWIPCCGCGDVLVGAAAAGMRIVGADADAANIAATQAALRAAAGVAPKRAVDPVDVTR